LLSGSAFASADTAGKAWITSPIAPSRTTKIRLGFG
jgi:hypothetical protein